MEPTEQRDRLRLSKGLFPALPTRFGLVQTCSSVYFLPGLGMGDIWPKLHWSIGQLEGSIVAKSRCWQTLYHFVIFAVLNGYFDITDDNVLYSVIWACLTICTGRKQPPYMKKTEIGRRWCDRFLNWSKIVNLWIKQVCVILLLIVLMNTWFQSKITWCMVWGIIM